MDEQQADEADDPGLAAYDGPAQACLVLSGEIAEIPRLAEAIQAFGTSQGVADSIVGSFALASEELVTNSILYGGPGLRIDVDMRIADGRFLMTITDNGHPFDPFSAPPPDITSPLEDRPVGGLGVHLVRSLMDEVGYVCHEGRNQTTIMKLLCPQGSPP